MRRHVKRILCLTFIVTIVVISSQIYTKPALAKQNTDISIQIQALLEQIQQLQIKLAELKNGAQNYSKCVQLTLSKSMSRGSVDTSTNGEVTKLQQFLIDTGYYTYAKSTGVFGPETELALQLWQKDKGVVTGGSPSTTGYGIVGPATRAMLKQICTPLRSGANAPVVGTSNIQTELEQHAQELNKFAPLQVDPQTRFENAYVLNGKMNQKYTITNDAARTENLKMLKAFYPKFLEAYCTDMKAYWYKNNNISLVGHYYDKDGVFLTTHEGTDKNCN